MQFKFLHSPETPDRSDPEPSDPEDWENAPAHIYLLLKRVFDHHSLLTVYIGQRPEAYTSAILEVLRDERYLVLDELTPRSGHLQLSADPYIQVRAVLDAVELKFQSRVTQISDLDGLPFYKVPFPERVSYPQRRRAHRVAIPLSRGIPVRFVLADERELECELRDLSPGGMCARIRGARLDVSLEIGDIAMCRIGLPGQRHIVTDTEICYVEDPISGRVPRIGARFINVSPEQARRIAQYCAELERQLRRAP